MRSTPSTQKNFGKLVRCCTNHLVPAFLSYQVMAKLHEPPLRRLSFSTHSLPPVLRHLFHPLIHQMTPSQYGLDHSLRTCYANEQFVHQLLTSLDVSKPSGPNDISAYMLKYTVASITPSVTMLFNQSLKFGRVPQIWKEARVTPIPN